MMFLRVQFTELIKNIMFFLFQVSRFQVSGFKLDFGAEKKWLDVFFTENTECTEMRFFLRQNDKIVDECDLFCHEEIKA
jgi:hypothetical protein